MNTTIAAISTPPGKGGVALLRISGPFAFSVAAAVFRPFGGGKTEQLPYRRATWGDILYEGDAIDDGMLTLFPAPNSYTGEDVAEITCHGGVLLTRKVLEALLLAGAVPAGPGEFTRRALVAGKITLSRAEGIGGVLDAQSDTELLLYRRTSRDALAERIGQLYEGLLSLISSVYARIDYPEEDLAELSLDEICASVEQIVLDSSSLIDTYKTGRAITEGIRTVLCGRANVGKSSLYNRLVGKDAAIVTEYAGTTRDVLEQTVSLGSVRLRLSDTAGVRETSDPIERIGVERSREAIDGAELLLAVFDGSCSLTEEDEEVIRTVGKASGVRIALINKSDAGVVIDTAHIAEGFDDCITVSAARGDLSVLEKRVNELFTDGTLTPGDSPIVSSARQYAALCRGKSTLMTALEALRAGVSLDAAASDMELALSAFGECDGHTVTGEVVDRIFSSFCVGK